MTISSFILGCKSQETSERSHRNKSASEILGNPNYQAISYGGYRNNSRSIQPSISELKEDMLILHAMGIRIIRTYNVQLPHASNILKAIEELKEEEATFEMYVMLGAWIDCKNAWSHQAPDHSQESSQNENEILRAVALAQQYPEIVKVIAVGNEAMVKWAASYYVQPEIILKWVNYIQDVKKKGKLPQDLWVTSSDNFASWGGQDEYRVPALEELIRAVDYISLHTYPMHDTHYNPEFWGLDEEENNFSIEDQNEIVMNHAIQYAQKQYGWVKDYVRSLDVQIPLHIGETGWASQSNELYGKGGSEACDEYKEALFYHKMRAWTNQEKISCFYFEAFDENWKDAQNEGGSENHFGLFTLEGKAKYALWNEVDKGVFEGLTRGGNPITKTFGGNKEALMQTVLAPPVNAEKQLQE